MNNTVHTMVPLKMDECFDLCVVGGGLAGVMAAISAAREGLRVLVVEKYGFLGGMACSGLVNPFMYFYEHGEGGKLANGGLFMTLLGRLYEVGGNSSPTDPSFMEEFLKLVLDRMCREAGVRVLFHALMHETEYEDGILRAITVGTVSGNIRITADYFIDGTGNGDLSAFSGLAYQQGREEDGLCQPMTLCFRLANCEWDKVDQPAMQALYRQLQKEGKIKNPRENIMADPIPAENFMHFNSTRIVGKDPVNVFDVTEAEGEAREQMYEIYRLMRDNIHGMENCVLSNAAPEIGIRESRRIVGYYQITEDDILSARKFDDRIARGTYEIDIHNPAGTGTVIKPIPEHDYYTIPYRAIVPKGAKNLLVAGRPISSTHAAHSSFRVMPITTCIGEAAGAAVALAKKHGTEVKEISVSELQSLLTDRGALV